MPVEGFLKRLRQGERVDFAETQSLISQHYRYTPVKLSNGFGRDAIENEAGVNEGSCRIFYFAWLHDLEKDATPRFIGDHYWIDVLQNSEQDNHRNIRNLIRTGWTGIRFAGAALTPLEPP
ncbi:MAG: HopJ type III effector protein [Methylococcales bacterium]